MKKRTLRHRVSGLVAVASFVTLLSGCGGDKPIVDPVPDASPSDGQASVQRGALLVSASDLRGAARVGTATAGADLLLLDAKTQRPIVGARVEAFAQDDGFLVRVSRDEEAYEPEVLQVRRGARSAVLVNPATADVRGQVLALGVQVFSEDFLGEGDINAVLGFAKTENRPSVVFLPALPPDAVIGTQKFKAYRATVPGTLLAVDAAAGPGNGAVVRGRAQVVGTQGISRAGVPLSGAQVQSASRSRLSPSFVAPAPVAVSITAPDASGAAMLSWAADDSAASLVGFDVGIDTTVPDKRVDKAVRSLPVVVKRGEHFACVRAVFDGSDVEPKLDCVNFDAPMAPAASNVRVKVRPLSISSTTPMRARQPVAVEVEVENTGDADTAAFDVAVVVSRDGRIATGEGETRVVRVDGIPAKTRARRVATVIPSRDGAMFIAAQADPKALLVESNADDNGTRLPIQVEPVGRNRAPVLSLTPASEGGAIKKGRPLPLNATAYDPEEGDISNRIVWTSTVDGYLGQGGSPTALTLSRGKHRLRATVRDQGVMMAPTPYDNDRLPGKGHGFGLLWPLQQAPVWAAEMDAPEQVVGEFEIEVVDETLPANSVPNVSAGPDLTTSIGVAVSPLATASDADGDPTTVKWLAQFDGVEVAMMDATTLSPKLLAATAGTYRLIVQVSDGKSATKDEMIVNVVADNAAPTMTVTLPPAAMVGMPVFANVVAVDGNADPLTVSYELGKPVGSAAVVQVEGLMMPSFIPDVPGVYTFMALADDGRGGKGMAQAQVTAAGVGLPDGGAPPDASVVVDAKPATPDAPLAMNVATGASCQQSMQCNSGFCVDGVCCGSPCLGLCESCAMPGMQGTCSKAQVGQNPQGDCPSGSSCNDVQQCGPFLVKPGAVPVAQGNVQLVGRGTYSDAPDDNHQRASCDPASRLCLLAVSPAGQSSSGALWVVSLDNPQSSPVVLPIMLFPGDSQTGFQSGVVLGTDVDGTAFAWKPGWQAPQFLSSGFNRDCKASPNGVFVACFTNQREDQTGFTVDIAVGALASGGNLPTVIGTAHHDLQAAEAPLELAFTADSSKLFVIGAKQPFANPSVRWWPSTGGNETVIVEEAALGGELGLSADGKWVVFSRQVTSTATSGSVGTLAFASTTGAPNVTNIDTNVGGFGFFANSELAYIKLAADFSKGELRRVVNLSAPTSSLIVDNAWPEGIRLARDGMRLAALRDTDADSVEELWTGRNDGTGWIMISEQPNIHLDGDAAFSAKGDMLVWQTGIDDSVSMPKALMATKLSAQGTAFSNQVGRGVSQWDFTDADGLISVGEFPLDRMSGGVLRIFDGMMVPGQVVQSSVGEHFAIVNDKILFTIQRNGVSEGAFVVNLALPNPMSACDPVSQMGCAAGQSCLVQGSGDIAGCGPTGGASLGSACTVSVGCALGLQCVNERCLRLCEINRSACPSEYPVCQLAPGNARYGACMTSGTMMPPDAGPPPTFDAGPPPQTFDAGVPPDAP